MGAMAVGLPHNVTEATISDAAGDVQTEFERCLGVDCVNDVDESFEHYVDAEGGMYCSQRCVFTAFEITAVV